MNHRVRPVAAQRVSVDVAHVPLQRLVLPWAVTAAGARHICLRQPDARDRRAIQPRRDASLRRRGGQLPFQFCAERQSAPNPCGSSPFGAPPPPAVIRAAERPAPRSATPTASPGLRPAYRLRPEPGLGRSVRPGRSQSPPGRAYWWPAPTCGWLTYMIDVPADGETMGEVPCAATTSCSATTPIPRPRRVISGRLVPLGRSRRGPSDGYIELRDRMKDIVISGGENISRSRWKGPRRSSGGGRGRHRRRTRRKWGEVPKASSP